MMAVHKMEPTDFLDYVHDLDLANVPENPRLSEAIDRLPGRKLIFTAGSRKHAENVAGKIGILHHFEDIMDIVDADFHPKEQAGAYDLFLKKHGVTATGAAMFEDMPHNLVVPHTLGMKTVLVYSQTVKHPVAQKVRSWSAPPEHIHHMTSDLTEFLEGDVLTKVDE